MTAIIATIADLLTTAVKTAITTGDSIRLAIADSLEEASAKVRSGELLPEEALDRSLLDQEIVDTARDKFR